MLSIENEVIDYYIKKISHAINLLFHKHPIQSAQQKKLLILYCNDNHCFSDRKLLERKFCKRFAKFNLELIKDKCIPHDRDTSIL